MKTTTKLDLLKRRQKGKAKFDAYCKLFFGFADRIWYDIEATDTIISHLREKALKNDPKSEFIDEHSTFVESDLLQKTYRSLTNLDRCFLFTDDYEYCGLFSLNAKEAFVRIFDIAKAAPLHTCFLVDKAFNYSFRINYYDTTHKDFPGSIDIQKYF